jgi:hypothetical protein
VQGFEQPKDVGAYWYDIVTDDSIRQGDIFRNLLVGWLPDDLPVPTPGEESKLREASLQFGRADWIVLSASCDVQPGRGSNQRQVLLGRVFACNEENLKDVKTAKDLKERVEVLRRGFDPMRYLLAQHTAEPELPLSFAVFRIQLTMPLAYLQKCCQGPRLRLDSPHRERFGNWAGACLSRVGIEDAEQVSFDKDPPLYPAHILRSIPDEE